MSGGPRRNCGRRYIRSPAARTGRQRDRHAERRGGERLRNAAECEADPPEAMTSIGGCRAAARRVKKGYRERHGTVDCLTAVMKEKNMDLTRCCGINSPSFSLSGREGMWHSYAFNMAEWVYGKVVSGYARERHCRTAGCLWTSEPGSAAGANEPDRAALPAGAHAVFRRKDARGDRRMRLNTSRGRYFVALWKAKHMK